MKYCTHCGREIPDESKFCGYCGMMQTEGKNLEITQEPKSETISQIDFVSTVEKRKQKKEKSSKNHNIFWLILAIVVIVIGAIVWGVNQKTKCLICGKNDATIEVDDGYICGTCAYNLLSLYGGNTNYRTSDLNTTPSTNAFETFSQTQAVGKAEQYLKYMYFSKKGLIEQLEYEGFSTSDAEYAVNQLNVDWKEQAVGKGKEYLKNFSFSREKFIDQLLFEGFSYAESTFAASVVGY